MSELDIAAMRAAAEKEKTTGRALTGKSWKHVEAAPVETRTAWRCSCGKLLRNNGARAGHSAMHARLREPHRYEPAATPSDTKERADE